MKKLRIKSYKIITIVHHPCSRLMMMDMYDKLIFISKVSYDKYKSFPNTEYHFWGPDLKFYEAIQTSDSIKDIDFIAAGKTLRDYKTFRDALLGLNVSYQIIGEKNSRKNEISYIQLLQLYQRAKYIVIPMAKIENEGSMLIGLTSFLDALGMGLPIIMSDNSNIGIDIDKLGIGFSYKVGDAEDLRSQLEKCISMTGSEYDAMCRKCRKFAKKNNFKKFSNRINNLIKS